MLSILFIYFNHYHDSKTLGFIYFCRLKNTPEAISLCGLMSSSRLSSLKQIQAQQSHTSNEIHVATCKKLPLTNIFFIHSNTMLVFLVLLFLVKALMKIKILASPQVLAQRLFYFLFIFYFYITFHSFQFRFMHFFKEIYAFFNHKKTQGLGMNPGGG